MRQQVISLMFPNSFTLEEEFAIHLYLSTIMFFSYFFLHFSFGSIFLLKISNTRWLFQNSDKKGKSNKKNNRMWLKGMLLFFLPYAFSSIKKIQWYYFIIQLKSYYFPSSCHKLWLQATGKSFLFRFSTHLCHEKQFKMLENHG